MNLHRRRFLLGASASLMAAPLLAQVSGSRTVRIVVPFSAGGPTDFIARLYAPLFAQELGLSVIVENRPGASGNIGMQQVATAEPDGLTLVHTTVAMQSINPIMYPSASFNPAKDLVPIGTTGALPNILVVHPSKLGVKTIEELIVKGKQPGAQLTYATFGLGTSSHIYGELLRKSANISAVAVPYKGSGNAITDVIAGHVDFLFDSMTTSVGHVRSGTLRGLAITSSERSRLLPDVPTLKEVGLPALDLKFWFILQAPAKTPPEMLERLRKASAKVLQNPSYGEGLISRGAEPLYVAPAELSDFISKDTNRWIAAARSIGLRPE